jgi:peptide/nickel transport system permease protein
MNQMSALNYKNDKENLWQIFFEDPIALVGLVVLLLLIALTAFAPLVVPQDPYDLAQLNLLDARLAPGSSSFDDKMIYILGTDDQGRDLFSAIVYGMRISMGVGLASTVGALVIGSTLGLIAAYTGKQVESIIMRLVDIQLSFPAILVALILLAVFGQGLDKIVISLITVQWAYYARTVRSTALVEMSKDYIQAARCLGLSHKRIIFMHLLPNCLAPLIVVAAVQVASAIALEATLSFLGLGLPITQPSLGLLISNGYSYMMSGKYWISLYPGLALLTMIVSINLVADRLRDTLNPKLQK